MLSGAFDDQFGVLHVQIKPFKELIPALFHILQFLYAIAQIRRVFKL